MPEGKAPSSLDRRFVVWGFMIVGTLSEVLSWPTSSHGKSLEARRPSRILSSEASYRDLNRTAS